MTDTNIAPAADKPRRGRRRNSGEMRDFNVRIGQRIRLRRSLLGLSQTELGNRIGLTFQQVQKYEKGTNAVSAGQLHLLANVLGVPVSYFYDDGDPSETTDLGADISRSELRLIRLWRRTPSEVGDRIVSLLADIIRASSDNEATGKAA